MQLRDPALSTVLLGHFNPVIFSPDWLLTNRIIGPDVAAFAREKGVEVMAPPITSINFGSMKMLVEEQRFMLLVGDEPLVRARDFPISCFRLLRHTPVSALGLNFNVPVVATDQERWHRFGDMLAPKAPWGEFLVDQTDTRHGGLRSIAVERKGADTDPFTYIRVSLAINEANPLEGLLTINHHFALGDGERLSTAGEASDLIDQHWEAAVQTAKDIAVQMKGVADAA